MAEPRRRRLDVAAHVEGVLAGDRSVLARTITLVESSAAAHAEKAETVLKELMPHTGGSVRVGITGSPGVGKSTFIEAFGMMLCDEGHRVAVLAVDPSSSVTRGSILGDKTRMERLSRDERAFIRPSPAAGTLGGVTRKSRETILLCEAAGFDVILVETVGVGQSEIAVRSMVDFFLLLLLPGAGDELQGIKKGVIELADALVVNKADGENRGPANRARAEYQQALRYLAPATEGWETRAHTCSALTGEGIPELWEMIRTFEDATRTSGAFQRRRRDQALQWVHAMVEERLLGRFFAHPAVRAVREEVEGAVRDGTLPATAAARALLDAFDGGVEEPGGRRAAGGG
jgi:LAO/AO transport system kinase